MLSQRFSSNSSLVSGTPQRVSKMDEDSMSNQISMRSERKRTDSSGLETSSDNEELKFIVVGQKLKSDEKLIEAIQEKCLISFNPNNVAHISYADTGFEFMKDADDDTVFVLPNFDGTIFQSLHQEQSRHRKQSVHGEGYHIMAPPVILKSYADHAEIPLKSRPLYSLTMDSVVICFSGFKTREELLRLADLVHRMGGGIRKEMNSNVTHLVAGRSGGEKYRTAVSMGTDIMSVDWIERCWELRDDLEVYAVNNDMMQYKLRPFSFCNLAFYGFDKDETQHMEEHTLANGGFIVEVGSSICTHIVVDERSVRNIPFQISSRVHVVKQEWLWASIQMDACADEMMYMFEGSLMDEMGTGSAENTPSGLSAGKGRHYLPPKGQSSGSRSLKRRKLKENLAQLAQAGEVDAPMFKRKSMEDDGGRKSLGSSFLDATKDGTVLAETTMNCNNVTCRESSPVSSNVIKELKNLTPRQQTILELFQTEKNYVGILRTIIKIFKEEIERVDQPGGPILDPQEIKAIFGGIPPLYDLHMKIRDRLGALVSSWSEYDNVGEIFLSHATELTKCYPNFVNYFEKTKETINSCDHSKPRFHAFLRLCQNKAECGRQSLTELLIRPVQRLPSVMLLLKEILKRTDKPHPDFVTLDRAIQTLEEVMTHINEDKRKTEGHQVMFEIINDVENCPPNLLSAHRNFIRRVDCIEVTDELCGKGNPVTLFVFSDSIEICKRRSKAMTGKSPAAPAPPSKNSQKPFKHITVLQFSTVKRVVDICDSNDCRNVFALITKQMDELEEHLLAFMIVDRSNDKDEFLTCLSKAICSSVCRADYETLLAAVEANVLNIDTSDLFGNKTFSRAATKFSKRVSRAFSLTKSGHSSHSGGGMKHSVSSMLQGCSPLRRDSRLFTLPPFFTVGGSLPRSPHGSISSSSCGLASCSDLTFDPSDSYSGIVDQMSIGTPSLQKRRETLAKSVDYVGQAQLGGGDADVFATPRSISRLNVPTASNTAVKSPYATMRRMCASTQSLYSPGAAGHHKMDVGDSIPSTPTGSISRGGWKK